MRRGLSIVALVSGAIIVATIAVYGRAHSGSLTDTAAPPIAAGDRVAAPALVGTTLTGSRVDLARLRGRPVVVNFFASWCAPCKTEGAAFAHVASEYRGRVRFLGVAIDDSRSGALAYARRYHWTWPIVYDPHDRLVSPFGLIGKPTTFVIDADGRIAWKLQRELKADELARTLDDVLAS